MHNSANKHILDSKMGGKRREKDRSHPLKDNKGHFKFRPSFKGQIQKKDAATPLGLYDHK
jgi:hypothetical protein